MVVRRQGRETIRRGREGQAMAEFLVGLVCIMFLVSGMMLVSTLSRRGFDAERGVRRTIAMQYAYPTFNEWPDFQFSEPTDPGDDGKPYTGDDEAVYGTDSFYQRFYLPRVYNDLIGDYYEDHNRLNPNDDLEYSDGIFVHGDSLDMIHAVQGSTVYLPPFLARMLDQESMFVGREIWMPRWNGILQ